MSGLFLTLVSMSTECKLNMSQTELAIFLPSQLLPQPHTSSFPSQATPSSLLFKPSLSYSPGPIHQRVLVVSAAACKKHADSDLFSPAPVHPNTPSHLSPGALTFPPNCFSCFRPHPLPQVLLWNIIRTLHLEFGTGSFPKVKVFITLLKLKFSVLPTSALFIAKIHVTNFVYSFYWRSPSLLIRI